MTWNEIKKCTADRKRWREKCKMEFGLYHGTSRKTKAKRLVLYTLDIVFSYTITCVLAKQNCIIDITTLADVIFITCHLTIIYHRMKMKEYRKVVPT